MQVVFQNKKLILLFISSTKNLKSKRIITIKKIAELANVSTGTVDRIIHNRGEVSQENIETVNAIIEKYGYKRNIFASNLAFNKKFTFVVFLPKYEQLEYWQTQINGIHKAFEEFKKFGIELKYQFYDFDMVSFKNAAQKVLSLECDGLLFAPIFYAESVAFLNEFQKKSLPIVMIDSNIDGFEGHAFIGQDAFKSGYLAGRLISFAVKNERQVLIIKITREIESTSVYLQRIDGFYSFFKDHSELTNFNFSEITIKDSGVNQLNVSQFEGINSVFVPNSRAYIVAKFLYENDIKGIRIIGYDLLNENVKYLMKGTIDFLINQKPEEQGYNGISYLYKKLVLKEEVDDKYLMPLEIIVKENCM